MKGDSPFVGTARVIRTRGLHPTSKLILATLTDAQVQSEKGGIVQYPEWSMAQIADQIGRSVTAVQRHLRVLTARGWVIRIRRPGLSYVFIPRVNQQNLPMQPSIPEQPSLPSLALKPREPHAVRGAHGRFTATPEADVTAEKFSTGPVVLTGPPARETELLNSGGPVVLTGQSGRCDRTSEPPDISSVRTDQTKKEESARADARSSLFEAVENSPDRTPAKPDSPATEPLRMIGIPMTKEQRDATARQPADDNNYQVIFTLALGIGRDPNEARKYFMGSIDEEGDLLEAVKRACAITHMRYDLSTKHGEGVVHAACKIAWAKLVREGVLREKPIELNKTRRRSRDQRR